MTKENVRKLLLAIIFVLILIVIALFIGRFTYSYIAPPPVDELVGDGEVTPSGDTIIFSKGNDISLNASTDNFYTGAGNLSGTTSPQVRLIASSDTGTANSTYFAGIRIYENTYQYSTTNQTAELILSVYDENGSLLQASSDTLPYVTVGGISGFDITGKTGAYNIAIDHPISTTSTTSGTTHTWRFVLTFINLDTDQSINETATLSMEAVLQKNRIEMPTIEEICSNNANSSLLSCYILSQYTGVDGDNGLYYHDADLANGAGDNSYRYAGASEDVNNYICFGSTASTCPNDNLYRIIGVFGNQVKLIKADYANSNLLGTGGAYNSSTYSASSYGNYTGNLTTINRYYWNNDTNTNTWSQSNLNTTNLNNTFLNTFSSTYRNKIADATWYVNGYSTNRATPATWHDAESTGTPVEAKIGLMYVSDYGFAASNSAWTTNMSSYNSSSITSNNWMYMGLYEWTISRFSSSTNIAYGVNSAGLVFSNTVYGSYNAVRPSFYLESSVSYVSGSGTATDPIRIN